MEEQTDKVVIKNMGILLVILIVFAFSIAFLARDIGYKEYQGKSIGSIAITKERIKPVADVYTDEEFFLAGIPASILLMVVLGLFVWFIWPMMGMPILAG